MDRAAVELRWCSADLLRAIATAERAPDWAPDFPDDIDRGVAQRFLELHEAGVGPEFPFGPFVIVDLAKGVVVGSIGAHGNPINGEVEIGYDVIKSERGRGIATAAILSLTATLSAEPGVEVIVARVARHNTPSARALLAAGFVQRPTAPTVGFDAFELVASPSVEH